MRPRKAAVFRDDRKQLPWIVRWSESTEDGRRVRRSRSFARQREAESFAGRLTRELRGEVPKASPVPVVTGSADTPLVVFVDEYFRRRSADLRTGTIERCRDTFDRLLLHFGGGASIGSLHAAGLSWFLTKRTNFHTWLFDFDYKIGQSLMFRHVPVRSSQ